MIHLRRRSIALGLAAAVAQFAFFLVLVTGISGWTTTAAQLSRAWYYLVALAIGFGAQVGLYVELRTAVRAAASGKVLAATGATSTAAMVSCCTHYLVNVLPILGVTGIASFVGQYQVQLFWLGLFLNAVGLAVIGRRLARFRSHPATVASGPQIRDPQPLIGHLTVLVVFGVVVTGVWLATQPRAADSGLAVPVTANLDRAASTPGGLPTQTNAEGGMTVAVTPRLGDGRWIFDVAIDNHVVGVTQDLVAVASLTTDDGTTVRPTAWEGDPPGGHHRHGTLTFTPPPTAAGGFTLTIRELGGVPERSFRWSNLP